MDLRVVNTLNMYLLTNLAGMSISSETVKETDGEPSVYFICAENQLPLKLSLMSSSTLISR